MRWLLTILLFCITREAFSRVIRVGPGESTRSLKKAIELAMDKDTILLTRGVYREGSFIITRSITLLGENGPVLDGENKYQILLISGKNIRVSGIYFRNSGYSALNDFAAVKLVDAMNVVIENNHIDNAYFAIHVSNTSYVTIRNNIITGVPATEQLSGNGIHLWKSNHADIDHNRVSGHRDGIYFEFVSFSLIRNNESKKNIRYGLHFMFSNDDTYQDNLFLDNGAGVAVMYSKRVNILHNRFEQNWGPSSYGILLKDISDSYISDNTFYRNTVGLHLEGTSRMEITKNIFRENGWAVKIQASCESNAFHQNNFNGNSFDVSTNSSLVLNTFNSNYWDKYDGYDINKDGVGDIPYHPVSMYSMIVEQNPNALLLMRSFTVSLLDKAEKAIPGLTPDNLVDDKPLMKSLKL